MASVDSTSDVRVSRYGVEIEVLDSFITKLPPIRSDTLLYIDEVGQMELHSDCFKVLVEECLSATNPFIGTLSSVYGDEFTDTLRARADVEIIEVTTKNRDNLADVLIERIKNTLVG
jgi:nucleoside-triphosphatase